jgi:hypothetical protein
MHGIVLVVHVVGRSKLIWWGLLLVFLHPSLVLASAAQEEDADAYYEQNPAGNTYRDTDDGAG